MDKSTKKINRDGYNVNIRFGQSKKNKNKERVEIDVKLLLSRK